MTLLALALGLGIVGFLIWWLLIETEGVYLGRRVVVALYDLVAHRYDRIKQFDDYADHALVSQALMAAIAPKTDPLILDVATGTGRLPLLMARNADFHGQVLGIDASQRMLSVAQEKVAAQGFAGLVTLLRQDASQLAFPAEQFDAVTCLEALEFLPDQAVALAEMTRVLKGGGLLLATIRIDSRWMPDRAWSESKMREALKGLGLRDIHFAIWQADYSQVWARKPATAA
ncbi:MAG: methyltransferase domain-containing protein [Chloroflexi bacterium]|nr:methyltransferase domain-containing protein [Chloroflexota bacterium]MCY4247003.1 methyltransferase domain-containing protein [Chloroflexota bacterium]